ncbi:GBF-interacting protein 1-like isoform X3 [Diospyros lotus]|uniref:GBF-interacting protein 1-like isoform X3 n=1 Tax=Diospyros lotus TaxID=55363 RepID=UPI002259A7AF|nr:GBF-interacting protein 1-like isoform X3 [Diospyros lotus]
MSSGDKDSIPNNVRKMVQNIKEIADSHSDEEIYAMLKECSMDPNETAQKLLLEDKFHEVKRKRDRKKENLSNKESAESRWRPGTQTRGSKGGRPNYFPRYAGNDTAGGRSSAPGKENGMNQVSDKGAFSSSSTSQESKSKEISPATSSHTITSNGPTAIASESLGVVHGAHLSVGSLVNQSDEGSTVDISKSADPPTILCPVNAKESHSIDFQTDKDGQVISSLSNSSAAGTKAPPAVHFSASDPVLMPSHDSWLSGAVGTIKREVGSQRVTAEQNSLVQPEGKPTAAAAYEDGSSLMQGNTPNKPVVVGKNKHPDSVQAASSTHGGSSVIRPSYNYNSRLQQAIGPQKGGPAKEWKPKPTNLNIAQGSGTAGASEVPTAVEAVAESHPVSSINDSREATSKSHKKLEELHISDGQHVIIPNHLHVPEADKIGFVFGSFDASFSLDIGRNNSPENDRTSAPGSETPKSFEEVAEQSSSQNQLVATEEGDYPNNTQSPRHVSEDLSSGEGGFSSTVDHEYSESKQETVLPSGSYQSTTVHTSPSYSFGFMPPVVGGQIAQFESSESQTHDVSRLPSFVVPQPLDPASYYAQFYRSGADSDGRISPFHPPAVATKYNGNVAMLSPQTSQTAQESGNPLATAAPALVTQAAGVMQSSIPMNQQPLPVFRQPTGLPITHYPPNYIPYGHYFSPFFVPPPALHQFLSNNAFPQQPQVGSIYPAPTGAATKYPLSQYKAGSNSGNSTHVGVPNSYGPYSSFPAGYNPSSSAAGNSTANEDLSAPQFKETNVYMTGQQSEGSAVWIATPGRDISGLQAGSFYNIPPQGQVTFTPTQGSHGTFAGIYHPAQAVSAASIHPLLPQSQTVASAVDIVGPTTSVYQQPQHSQINWPNNY